MITADIFILLNSGKIVFYTYLTPLLLSITIPHVLNIIASFSIYALNQLYMVCKTSRL